MLEKIFCKFCPCILDFFPEQGEVTATWLNGTSKQVEQDFRQTLLLLAGKEPVFVCSVMSDKAAHVVGRRGKSIKSLCTGTKCFLQIDRATTSQGYQKISGWPDLGLVFTFSSEDKTSESKRVVQYLEEIAKNARTLVQDHISQCAEAKRQAERRAENFKSTYEEGFADEFVAQKFDRERAWEMNKARDAARHCRRQGNDLTENASVLLAHILSNRDELFSRLRALREVMQYDNTTEDQTGEAKLLIVDSVGILASLLDSLWTTPNILKCLKHTPKASELQRESAQILDQARFGAMSYAELADTTDRIKEARLWQFLASLPFQEARLNKKREMRKKRETRGKAHQKKVHGGRHKAGETTPVEGSEASDGQASEDNSHSLPSASSLDTSEQEQM
jgi:hypothetical protein